MKIGLLHLLKAVGSSVFNTSMDIYYTDAPTNGEIFWFKSFTEYRYYYLSTVQKVYSFYWFQIIRTSNSWYFFRAKS